ncbi:MFS transporter [Sphingobium sp.]|uniref:MFS transporter n=1 Tax=Sphingobium sp. TaxID=1912891 RepID=UPI0028BE7B5C|nr:MFS transporter [Sphingobium sp.]
MIQDTTTNQPSRKWVLFVAILVLADITSGIESTMIYSAMKELIAIYGDAANVGWLVTGYVLVSAAAAAIFGRLGDIYGRKRMVIIVLACAVIGSLISAMTRELTVMILGRALQGVAGAIMPLSFGLAREVIPVRRLPLAIGILYSAGAIGGMVGMVLGGVLVDAGGWHWIFLVSAMVAGLSLIFAAVLLPRGPVATNPGRIDKLGGILFVPAVAAMLLGLTNVRLWGLLDMRILALLIGGMALFIIWLRYEWRHPQPLIDVRLFTRRELLAAMACMALFAGGGAQVMQLQMLFLQQPVSTGIGLGLTATLAGLLMMAPNLSATLMAPVAGHIAGSRGNRFVVICGFMLNATGWLLLTTFNSNIWIVMTITSLACMAGNALLGVGIYNSVIAAAPFDRTSEAGGVVTVVRGLSHAVSAQIIMVILAHSTVAGSAGAGHPAPIGYLTVFAFIAGLSLIGILLATRLRGRPDRPAEALQTGVEPAHV